MGIWAENRIKLPGEKENRHVDCGVGRHIRRNGQVPGCKAVDFCHHSHIWHMPDKGLRSSS